MTKTVLTIVALVAFGLAAFGITVSTLALVPFGLGAYVAAELFGCKSK